MKVDREVVRWYRLHANDLASRLPAGSLAAAARSGLQDSSPWSGVLSLHARVADVPVGAWEAPALVQVFGPRGAIYLVPRADLAVFTLGQLPRDATRLAAIEADAERYRERLADGETGLDNTRRTRWAGATGRFVLRWDARTTTVTAAPAPDADPEECRLELARRYLHVAGPATVAHLQWFVDGSRADAEATFAAIRPELVQVDAGGPPRWVLASDGEDLFGARPPAGVRLLPPDDPYLSRADKEVLVTDPGRRAELWPKAPAPGALLIDGDLAGTWRRQERRVTVAPWFARVTPPLEEAVAAEAAAMPLPGPPESAVVDWTL